MADGTISLADGLGLKALDSNEVRRRQQSSDLTKFPQSQMGVEIQQMSNSGNLNSGFTLGNEEHATSSAGFGAFSPKTSKNTSPSRKLQQVFEEALGREAEDQASDLFGSNTKIENISDHLIMQSINPKSPKSIRNPSSAQKLFD